MMNEFDELLTALGSAGGDRAILDDPETAHLVVIGKRIVSSRSLPGLDVEAAETEGGVRLKILLREGVHLTTPVHTCFGVVHSRGDQHIEIEVTLEPDSSARFIAHCLFPNAEHVRHSMDATVEIGAGATLGYQERHYHGPHGGIEVMPKATVRIGSGGRYTSDFTLTDGRVGSLDIDYEVDAAADAVVELTARVFGHGNDEIRIRERVVLGGQNARGIIKTRIAVEDDSLAEITGITEGNAAGARGHVDCMEIIRGQAVAKAIPIVSVTHPQAKVTHEAAIGSVDKHQLETLMAHGLSPEEAVDVIVKGMLG
ncbi:MAG: SufD family Fe-S cluster assembly protein [Desulfuromonadaceae bacterium]|nr:SufD family Fe-S cluster assembly protein [Desulfuromonadaceae bacterium]MDD2849922.1 SufD family Fe-S cluster assembly protein [Desulfuromonadaceae bacterium]MDD4131719.1 SufD family Fe-S cluster assembly protein [Desulfuromonadaceae bacterium]